MNWKLRWANLEQAALRIVASYARALVGFGVAAQTRVVEKLSDTTVAGWTGLKIAAYAALFPAALRAIEALAAAVDPDIPPSGDN